MRIGKRIILIVVTLFMFFAVYSSTLAAAPAPHNFEMNWTVTVNFAGDTPNAVLVVDVWKIDSITHDVIDSYNHTQTLNCTVPPSVKLFGDQAYFDGSAGIQCDMPSIQDIVYKLTNEEFKLPEECTCKTGAVVWSDIQLRPNLTTTNWSNPIATMDDIAFSSPIPAQSHLRTNLEMTVDSVTAVSQWYSAKKSSTILKGSFDEINPYGVPFYTYINAFTADLEYLGAAPAMVNAPLLISNVQPALHIGFDPATKEGLHGVMTELFVDPGCFGGGGY